MGRAKKRRGSPACFLSAISGWFSLSILARECRRIWRGELRFIGFGGATLLDRIGPPGRCSGGWPHDRNSWLMPRVNPPRVNLFYHPYARARARQWSARCCGVARQRDRSRPKAAGVSGVLSLRHWVPKNLARRVSGKQERLLTNRPCSSLVYKESDSKERLRVSNWIVQRL